MKLERRAFQFELRAAKDDTRRIEGYAAVFNSMSEPLGYGGWREMILPGAFTETLADSAREIFGLWNHNSDIPLSSRQEGTLDLAEDEKGLSFGMTLDESHWGAFALTAVRSGRVKKMSFGFETLTDDWKLIDGNEVRILEKVKLWEISPVTWPAYTDTSAESRSLVEARHKQFLVKAGAASEADKSAVAVRLALNAHRTRSNQ